MNFNLLIDSKLAAEVREIAARLLSQDNRATDAPIFVVEEKRRVTGFDPAYSDKVVWIDTANDCAEADPEEHARLEGEWDATGDEPDGWSRTAYQDEWRYVTACFTAVGCEEYIRRNGHNHRGELRVFAAGSYRNREFRAIRELLLAFAACADPGIRARSPDERPDAADPRRDLPEPGDAGRLRR